MSGTLVGAGSWLEQLQPASFRGVPFKVMQSRVVGARQTAIHTYPFRDEVWVEDLGRGEQRYEFRGFVVGNDCFVQRDALRFAVRAVRGAGVLVHPSLGSITVGAVGFEAIESADSGQVVELVLAFVETVGTVSTPAITQNAQSLIGSQTAAVLASGSSDFASQVQAVVAPSYAAVQGAAAQAADVVQGAVQAVRGWTSLATAVTGDASLLSHAVVGLPGNLGRYAGGGRITLQTGITTVDQALSAVTTARTAVGQTISDAGRLAAAL